MLQRLVGVESKTAKQDEAIKELREHGGGNSLGAVHSSRGLTKQESIMNAETSHAANTSLGLAKKALTDASQALAEAQRAADDVNRMSAQVREPPILLSPSLPNTLPFASARHLQGSSEHS
jgi:hypothetical protein